MTDIAHRAAQPIFNIPPMTLALLLANIGVHLIRLLLPQALDEQLVFTFAFVPARYLDAALWSWPVWVEPVSYQFLHGGWLHLGINMLSLLAFGAGVEQRLGAWRYLIFYLGCGILAAGTEFTVEAHSVGLMIGASGAISGLFGAILRFRVHPRSLWIVAVVWLAMNVATGSDSIIGPVDGMVAWIAHIGGFVAGLAAFPLFDTWRRIPDSDRAGSG
jgi:membrane associated rhomboid family serine protease